MSRGRGGGSWPPAELSFPAFSPAPPPVLPAGSPPTAAPMALAVPASCDEGDGIVRRQRHNGTTQGVQSDLAVIAGGHVCGPTIARISSTSRSCACVCKSYRPATPCSRRPPSNSASFRTPPHTTPHHTHHGRSCQQQPVERAEPATCRQAATSTTTSGCCRATRAIACCAVTSRTATKAGSRCGLQACRKAQ